MSEEAQEPRARPPKPKRKRRGIDWTVVIMILGTLIFIVIFGAITLMAPRRPMLFVRGLIPAPAKPTVVATPSAAANATKPASPAPTAPPKS
jgi:quinol-cytochrome oxidoreductase complex cytochrome b subunit